MIHIISIIAAILIIFIALNKKFNNNDVTKISICFGLAIIILGASGALNHTIFSKSKEMTEIQLQDSDEEYPNTLTSIFPDDKKDVEIWYDGKLIFKAIPDYFVIDEDDCMVSMSCYNMSYKYITKDGHKGERLYD